jgi:hypothetical protein
MRARRGQTTAISSGRCNRHTPRRRTGGPTAGAWVVGSSSRVNRRGRAHCRDRAAFSADALAEQTGLGAGFVGLIFGGIATSLPELSTTVSAVRLMQYVRRAVGRRLGRHYLVGLAARSRRSVWRMDIDPVTVLVMSAMGLVILYHLRYRALWPRLV